MSYWPELRETLVSAAHREYGARAPASPPARTARPFRRPTLSSVAVLIASGTAIAVAVLALTLVRHAPQSTSSVGPSHARVSEREARKVAEHTLRQLVLPAGALRWRLVPGTLPDLSQPVDLIATPHRVDVFRVWRLAESSARVLIFIEAHRPAGSRLEIHGEGGSGPPGGPMVIDQARFVFRLPDRGDTGFVRELAVVVGPLPGGGTIVRADGEAGWLYPRTAADLIPAGIDRLVVTTSKSDRRHAQLSRTASITSGRQVQRLVALLNALPAAPPPGVPWARRCIDAAVSVRFYAAGVAKPVSWVIYFPACGIMLSGHPDQSHPRDFRFRDAIYLRVASPISDLTSLAPKLP